MGPSNTVLDSVVSERRKISLSEPTFIVFNERSKDVKCRKYEFFMVFMVVQSVCGKRRIFHCFLKVMMVSKEN